MKYNRLEHIFISDFFRLAALRLQGVREVGHFEKSQNLYLYFNRQEAERVLEAYEAGMLTGSLKAYVEEIKRVRDEGRKYRERKK